VGVTIGEEQGPTQWDGLLGSYWCNGLVTPIINGNPIELAHFALK